MSKTAYTSWDVMRLFRLKWGRFREWVERGYIRPSIQRAEGPGTRNLFSKLDLLAIGVFDALLGSGFSRDAAASIIHLFSEQVAESLKRQTGADFYASIKILVVTRRKDAYSAALHFAGQDLMNSIPFLKGWELVHMVSIEAIKRKLPKG